MIIRETKIHNQQWIFITHHGHACLIEGEHSGVRRENKLDWEEAGRHHAREAQVGRKAAQRDRGGGVGEKENQCNNNLGKGMSHYWLLRETFVASVLVNYI